MDSIFQSPKFNDSCRNILQLFEKKPFLCTPMSAALLAELEYSFPERSFKIKTGDLLYDDCILFKQNFDLNLLIPDENNTIKTEWDGHCWVEFDNRYIIDISLFRTIYSDAFTKPCKKDILSKFGTDGGCLIIDKQNPEFLFRYIEHNELQKNIIDGILQSVSLYMNQPNSI
ncbi:MAG: hypothetical protein ACRC2T_06440 [Thermoguttaceae bacterium]